MTCFAPLPAFRFYDAKTGEVVTRLGNKPSWQNVLDDFKVPCGKCIGCKLEYSRVWAVRCTHEASLYPDNCFLTLTYDQEHIPVNRSLDKSHFQKFMKRLRKLHTGLTSVKRPNFHLGFDEWVRPIRFYMCGEYGEKSLRPHYHALLFNFDFSDKKLYRHCGDYQIYTSEELTDIWGMGHASLGQVNFHTASYVARYACKSADGLDRRLFAASYKCCDIATRSLRSCCIPQYTDMSRAWGIGAGWYEKYGYSDVYSDDHLIINGKKTRPPRFYDNKFAAQCGEQALSDVKRQRVLTAESAVGITPEGLRAREECVRARMKQLKRSLEYGDA